MQRGGEWGVIQYGEPDPCRKCGGAGTITLLVTARACEACQGTGRFRPVLRHEHTPARMGYVRRKRTFDDLGRVIVEEHWFEPVASGDQAGK